MNRYASTRSKILLLCVIAIAFGIIWLLHLPKRIIGISSYYLTGITSSGQPLYHFSAILTNACRLWKIIISYQQNPFLHAIENYYLIAFVIFFKYRKA